MENLSTKDGREAYFDRILREESADMKKSKSYQPKHSKKRPNILGYLWVFVKGKMAIKPVKYNA